MPLMRLGPSAHPHKITAKGPGLLSGQDEIGSAGRTDSRNPVDPRKQSIQHLPGTLRATEAPSASASTLLNVHSAGHKLGLPLQASRQTPSMWQTVITASPPDSHSEFQSHRFTWPLSSGPGACVPCIAKKHKHVSLTFQSHSHRKPADRYTMARDR